MCSLSWRMYTIGKTLSYLWSSYGAKHSTTTSRWLFVSETQETDLEPCEFVIPLSCVLVICDVLLKLVAFWSLCSFMASDFTLLIESKHKISDWSNEYSISVWFVIKWQDSINYISKWISNCHFEGYITPIMTFIVG